MKEGKGGRKGAGCRPSGPIGSQMIPDPTHPYSKKMAIFPNGRDLRPFIVWSVNYTFIKGKKLILLIKEISSLQDVFFVLFPSLKTYV